MLMLVVGLQVQRPVMDIVSLSPQSRSERKPQTHATEWKLGSSENTSTYHHQSTSTLTSNKSFHEDNNFTGLKKSASWHSLKNIDLEEHEAESPCYECSQTALQEVRCPLPDYLETHKHGYQLSYELALDNIVPHFTSTDQLFGKTSPTSYTDHVIMEILTSERTYVEDLTNIVEGYIVPLEGCVGAMEVSMIDLDNLFGNIREIKAFNCSILQTLKSCGNNRKSVGLCFLRKAEGFKTHYSNFCNNYPSSIRVLSRLQRDSVVSEFLQICQQRLNHMLPLEAYLLKPVQRVLKYALLLGQLVKHMSVEDDGFKEVSFALDKMTSVSKHINEMKKRYDAEVYIQRVQSSIRGLEEIDLTKAGELVMEESLRYGGRTTVPSIKGRADRHAYVFLFTKLMLMTKKEDDGYIYRTHLEVKDIQLTERVEKEVNCFQVRQVSTGNYYTLQAPSFKSKEKWVETIKRLLMESLPGLPDKAKMLILAGFPTDYGNAAKRSPKSPLHQRHYSDQHSPSSSRSEKRHVSRQSKTSSNLIQHSRVKARARSTTSPSLLTKHLVQASLIATLQLEPYRQEAPSTEEKTKVTGLSTGMTEMRVVNEKRREKIREECLPIVKISPPNMHTPDATDQTSSTNGREKGPSGHFDEQQILQEVPVDSESMHSDVAARIKLGVLSVPVTSIPKNVAYFQDDENIKAEADQVSCNTPPMFHQREELSPIHPDEVKYVSGAESYDSADDEVLFNDKYNNLETSTSLNQIDAQTLHSLLQCSQDSINEPDISECIGTPQLAPPLQFADDGDVQMTRPHWWEVNQSKKSPLADDIHFSSAPLSAANHSAETNCQNITKEINIDEPHLVIRRHSYTSQQERKTIHLREGSKSSSNSPEASPSSFYKKKKRQNSLNTKRQSKFTKESNFEEGMGDNVKHNTMAKLDCDQHSTRYDTSQMKSLYVSSPAHEEKSFEMQAEEQYLQSSTEEYVHLPFVGNPNEQLSFDDILKSYDRYASATGETTKTKRKESKQLRAQIISKRETRKKDRRRSMTVSSIDTTTLYAMKDMSPDQPRGRVSRVQQLAREYSRRIKEHKQGSWFNHSSTSGTSHSICMEGTHDKQPEEDKPDWLIELPKQASPESSHESKDDYNSPDADLHGTEECSCPLAVDCPSTNDDQTSARYGRNNLQQLPHIRTVDQVTDYDPVELQRKGRLKGWVKAVVVKFGVNKL